MDYFKIKWKQEEGSVPVEQTFKIGTDKVIQELQPLNSNWNSAGCYAGALAQNGSLMGSSSTLVFTGWNSNQYYSDLRNFQIQPSIPSGQQNLRFMAKFSESSILPVKRQAFNWTGLTDGLVSKINDGFANSSSSISQLYDPYRLDLKNLNINGTANSPLNVAPLNELKINNLIFVPYFIIKSVEYYGKIDDLSDLNAYGNIRSTNVGVYTWDQIKPEDKSAEGSEYNSDLFTKGYEVDENPYYEDGLKFNYVAGCVLVPYYGKSSKIYNQATDSYIASTNPEDQKVYGERKIFGSINSDTNEYPTVYSTAQPRPNLIVLTEFSSSVTGGTVYATPPGIAFMAAAPPNASVFDPSDYGLRPNFTLDQNFQKFSTPENWSPFYFPNGSEYCNFYQDYNPDTPDRPAPDLVIPSTHIELNNDIVANLPQTTPTGTIYYLPDNTIPIAHTWSQNGRQINPTTCSFFSIQALWATIASLGCYVADNASCAQNAPTGAYVGQNNHLYLGQMNVDGVTTGIMLQGSDIANSTQSRIDDIIQNTPYVPVNPDEQGGGDEPTDPSVPKKDTGNIGLNDISNLVIGGVQSFLTGWILNDQQVINISRHLWSSVNASSEEDADAMLSNFYRIFHRNYDPEDPETTVDYELSLAEILDYFIGLKWFPFDCQSTFTTISSGQQGIRVGTGASLISAGGVTTFLQGATAQLEGGSVTIPYSYESYLDLEPYTSASIYIPYCGTTEVQPSLIMGRTLTLTYAVSALTGTLCAIVMVQSGSISYPLCVLNGMCGFDIAISGNTQNAQIRNGVAARDNHYLGQWQSIVGGLGTTAKNVGIASLGSGLSKTGSAANPAELSQFKMDLTSRGASFAMQNNANVAGNILGGVASAAAGLSLGAGLATIGGDLALEGAAYKNQIPYTLGTQPLVVGSSSSMANLILPQTAFVQIRRKNRHDLNSSAYGNTYGYQSKNEKRIGSLTGLIKCVNPKVSISGALSSEIEEIYSLLATGVYRK